MYGTWDKKNIHVVTKKRTVWKERSKDEFELKPANHVKDSVSRCSGRENANAANR